MIKHLFVKHPYFGEAEISFPQPSLGKNQYCIFIGENGSGKTTILKSLVDSILDSRINYKKNSIQTSWYDSSRINRVIVSSLTTNEQYPLNDRMKGRFVPSHIENDDESNYYYVGYRKPSGYGNVFSIEKNRVAEIIFSQLRDFRAKERICHCLEKLGYSSNIKVEVSKATISKSFVSDLKNRIESRRVQKYLMSFLDSEEELRQLEYVYNLFKGKRTFDIDILRIDELSPFFYFKEVWLLERLGYINLDKYFLYKGEREVSISQLSSGELQLLTTLGSISALARDDSLIIIDEPGVSFHPEYQAMFLSKLRETLKGMNGIQVLIATHSPFFLSDHKNHSSTIFTVKTTGGKWDVESYKANTYGRSIEDLLLEVFGIITPCSVYVSSKIKSIIENINYLKKEEATNRPEVRSKTKKMINELKSKTLVDKEASPIKQLLVIVDRYIS